MKNKIYIKQWLEFKPYNNQTDTDAYYLNLSNTIKKSLSSQYFFVLLMYLNEQEIDALSCFLASYFEDIISETDIWKTFSEIYFEHYKKRLPFYDTKEYFEGEINEQDIAFLIWYFLNTVQKEKVISPANDFITEIAAKVMILLEDEYEYALENNHLKQFYTLDENETDFYTVRNLIDTILFKTYLFYPDTALKLAEQELELIEENDDENLNHYLQETRDSLLHKSHTSLMSLKGKEWAARILGDKHPVSSHLLQMSPRIRGFFLYKGQDDLNIFIEHIASGKKFKLTQKSFDHSHLLNSMDTIMYIGIVKWQKEWWFSGVYFQNDFNADLVLNEKNSLESRMVVNFLDHNTQETNQTLKIHIDAFLDFNNGSQIAFMHVDKINEFIKNYMEYLNATLNLSDKEIEEAKERARADGYFRDMNDPQIDFPKEAETGLVFFNSGSGTEIAINLNSAFPLSNNPYFNVEESEKDVMDLFISEEISTELSKYCIKHCKSKLPFLKRGIGKMYLKDIDFLLRFWKRENYFAKPSITYTGQ